MKCPRCNQDVLWRQRTNTPAVTYELYNYEPAVVTVGEVDISGEILSKSEMLPIKDHECSVVAVEEKSIEELQAEFWVDARAEGLRHYCPRCTALAQDPCWDLRYKDQAHFTEWPHKERFVEHMDPLVIAEAEKRRWL